MGILIGLHTQRGAENEKGWSVDMRDGANGPDAKTEQTDSAGQVGAIQTLYSLQKAINNGPEKKIKHGKFS